MRYSVISTFIISIAIVLLSACKESGDIKIAVKYGVNVSLKLDDTYASYKEKVQKVEVKAVNQQTSQEYVETGGYSDSWQIELPSGEYNVSVIMTLNEDPNENIQSFNGVKNSVGVYSKENVDVELFPIIPSELIFKEIYYSMTKTNTNAQYLYDQFYEIYNNTNEVQYLDNCLLARHQGSGSAVIPCRWVDENGDILKEYPTESYIAAFIGDGSGKTYPLQPGNSVVVAFQARNHKTSSNPNSVDLSGANYEVNISAWKTDYVNNPNVEDMTIIEKVGEASYAFWMLPYSGTGTILAKFPDNIDLKEYVKDMANWKTIPFQTSDTELYLMIPQDYVKDGVNIVGVDPAKRQVQLRAEVDAGMVTNSEVYNGKSIKRKVIKEENGRIIYQDTNNSSNDFLTDQTPTPGIDANGKVINPKIVKK